MTEKQEIIILLKTHGIDLELLNIFAKDCTSIQKCINKILRISKNKEISNPGYEFTKILTWTVAELSFRNKLAFKYAFDLELKTKDIK